MNSYAIGGLRECEPTRRLPSLPVKDNRGTPWEVLVTEILIKVRLQTPPVQTKPTQMGKGVLIRITVLNLQSLCDNSSVPPVLGQTVLPDLKAHYHILLTRLTSIILLRCGLQIILPMSIQEPIILLMSLTTIYNRPSVGPHYFGFGNCKETCRRNNRTQEKPVDFQSK